MTTTLVRETEAAYRRLRRFVPLGVLNSEKDYQKAMAMLDEIIDEIGQDETHPLADLAEALAMFIHSYEETHAKIREATGPEVLRSLMEEHHLTQSGLPEIGSQGVVSEILSGPPSSERGMMRSWAAISSDSVTISFFVLTRRRMPMSPGGHSIFYFSSALTVRAPTANIAPDT